MIAIPHAARIYLALGATDMRKSYDTLAEATRTRIGEDPLSGHLFVFCNGGRNRLKILYWDGSGYWLFAKRLERGSFAWPGRLASGETAMEMQSHELMALVGGIDLRRAVQRPRYDARVTPGTLQQTVARLEAHVAELTDLVGEKERRIREMAARIDYLERRVYGPSRERISPDQLRLAFAEEEAPIPPHALEAPDEEETRPPQSRKKHPGRKPLPDTLRRERVEYALEDCACPHCGVEMAKIGEEITEELEYVPACCFVREHARLKYGCKGCGQGIVIAPTPVRPIHVRHNEITSGMTA